MNFKSDNTCAVSSEIMNAIIEVNKGIQNSYGADDYSIKLKQIFSQIFEKEVSVYLTCTGTAANALSLSSLTKPYELILCHEKAHINTDECGAPIFFTGGANLMLISGENGKINPNNLVNQLGFIQSVRPRIQKAGCISITQATECGTVYTLDELSYIAGIAKKYSIPIHMDGARFANSLIKLGISPAEGTWKSGIDIMSFGATKNGCLQAEAIVIFNQNYVSNFDYLHKRAGQLISKTRFFSAQFLAYFENNLWLRNATHANSMAQNLKIIFEKYEIPIECNIDINQIFVTIEDKNLVRHLLKYGCGFYPWGIPEENLYRFVTSCFTEMIEIEQLDECLHNYKTLQVK